MSIYLIRHGESLANAGAATADPQTIGLTQHGREQAAFVAQTVCGYGIRPDIIIASSYIRTQETAQPLKQVFPQVPLEIWNTHEFSYLAKFSCMATTVAYRRADRDAYWERSDPNFVHSPGSESFHDFIERVSSTLCRLCLTDKTILFFGHQLFICGLLWLMERGEKENLTHEDMKDFELFASTHKIPNASLIAFDPDAKRWEMLCTPQKAARDTCIPCTNYR